VLVVFLLGSVVAHTQSMVHVRQQRVWSTIEKLSTFGRPTGSGFEDGVTRVGFSEADMLRATG
jgi:hypothetical protein